MGHDADENALVRMMIGRQIEEYFPGHRGSPAGREVLRVDSLSSPGAFADVSLTVHAGEILGIAGLVGSAAVRWPRRCSALILVQEDRYCLTDVT